MENPLIVVNRIKFYNYLTKKQFITIREGYSCRVRKFMWNLRRNCLSAMMWTYWCAAADLRELQQQSVQQKTGLRFF